jgi:uncharacterized protein DUF4386
LEHPRWGSRIEEEASQAREETMIERAQRSAAKIFAVTYLFGLAIIMVVFSRFYAPYLVWENGEETARHFVHHEEAIRIYLAGALVHGVGMIVLLSALYVLLRSVNRGMALCAAFSRVIYAVFWFIFVLDMLGALRFFGGSGRAAGVWARWAGGVSRSATRCGPRCLLHWLGVQRAGIGAVCLGAVSIAVHSASSGVVGCCKRCL